MTKKKPRKKTSALAIKTPDIKEEELLPLPEFPAPAPEEEPIVAGDIEYEPPIAPDLKAIMVREEAATKKVPPPKPPKRPTFQDLLGWTTTPQQVGEARKIYKKFEEEYDRWVSENC